MEKTSYKKSPEFNYKNNTQVGSWLRPSPKKGKISIINYSVQPKQLLLDVGEKYLIKLNNNLNNIYDSIEKSKYILELPDNWDDEGSERFEQETWNRAIKFVVYNANCIYDKLGKVIGTPTITQASEGSIDIYWKNENYQLLVNIPSDKKELASYYGENFHSKEQTEGYTNDTSFTLMSCLQNLNQ